MNRNPNTNCFHCEVAIYVRPNQMAKQNRWFCSKACQVLANPRKKYICKQCQQEFSFTKGKSNNVTATYCSRECSNKGRTGIKYKQGQPNNKVSKLALRRAIIISRDGPNCKNCGMAPIWNGLPLVLQIDHIDGNNQNNDPLNWRLLCPNCHTQTDTFAGKNIKKKVNFSA